MSSPPVTRPEDGIEIVREERGAETSSAFEMIRIPRYVVYVQACMLVGVGLFCFLMGVAVGGRLSEGAPGAKSASGSAALSGRVLYMAPGGKQFPDQGAVVIALPQFLKPDEKFSLAGLRPEDDRTVGERTREAIRSLGGDVGRADESGRFKMSLVSSGRYFLLVLSANGRRASGMALKTTDRNQMADYFDFSKGDVGPSKTLWQLKDLGRSQDLSLEVK